MASTSHEPRKREPHSQLKWFRSLETSSRGRKSCAWSFDDPIQRMMPARSEQRCKSNAEMCMAYLLSTAKFLVHVKTVAGQENRFHDGGSVRRGSVACADAGCGCEGGRGGGLGRGSGPANRMEGNASGRRSCPCCRRPAVPLLTWVQTQ